MNSSLERARKLQIGGTYAFFVIGSIIMIFPFVWMFLTSFKTVEESMAIPPGILPEHWQFNNCLLYTSRTQEPCSKSRLPSLCRPA